MKILVTGCAGQLGQSMRDVLEVRAPGISTYIDIDDLDLTDTKAVELYLRKGDFSHVINCAAYTAVDRAEEDKAVCAAVNTDAVTNLARIADELGLRTLHISTDYVFDGTAHRPYSESDKVNPLSHYGTTKRKGETALIGLSLQSIIVRTGWLYSPYGHNFVKTILERAARGESLRVVADQIGTPTYAADLADAIATIVLSPQWISGIYHFSNEGVASWYDFAVAATEIAGIEAKITPILTDDYPTAATRPFYAVLDKSLIKATYGIEIPYWRHSLSRCIERIQHGDDHKQTV